LYPSRNEFEADRTEFSALVILIREFGSCGFNLELKTEETIMTGLQEIEEAGFNKLMRRSILLTMHIKSQATGIESIQTLCVLIFR
jgi:hypothetical protein